MILKACAAAGSVCQTYFDIRFNPDVCSPGMKLTRTHAYGVIVTGTHSLVLIGVSCRRSFPLRLRRRGSKAEAFAVGRGGFSAVQSDSSTGETGEENEILSWYRTD